MKQYPFADHKAWKILFGLFLLAVLLLARDTQVTTSLLGLRSSQFLMLGLMAAAGVCFLIVNRRDLRQILRDRRILWSLILSVPILLPMLVKRDWQLMYFSVLLCLLFSVFLTYFVSSEQVARYYVVILCALGIYSLLATYVLRSFLDRGIISVPVFTNSMDAEYYNFGLCYPSKTWVKNRNFGIFREPGVYQYFLLLGLYLNNCTVEWKKSWQMWTVNGILGITMLSTFATGGVIEMGLLAILLFIDKKWYKDKVIRTAAIVMVVLMLMGVGLIVLQKGDLYTELTGMIFKFTENPESTGSRFQSIFVDAGIFFAHPFFGDDLGSVLYAVTDNTTSTMVMFAAFGILGGLLHTASWVALVWERRRSILMNLALLLVMFMSFNTQNLIVDVFFWLFPMMALTERVLPWVCRRLSERKGKKE